MLKPGGTLTLELPCIEKVFEYIAICVQQGIEMSNGMVMHALYGDPRHRDVHMTHKWGWTKVALMKMLKDVGFSEVRDEEPRYHFPVRDMRIVGVK